MFGRPARLPADAVLAIPYEGSTADAKKITQATRDNLRIAFELAGRNVSECAAKLTAGNKLHRRTLCLIQTNKM